MSDIPSPPKSQAPTAIDVIAASVRDYDGKFESPTEAAMNAVAALREAGYIIVRRETIAPTGGEKP